MTIQGKRMPRVDPSHFAMVPRADIPRSRFTSTHTHKTTFDGGYLYPIFVDEALPGDVIHGRMTCFARFLNLLFPLMDEVCLESFFFAVPNRLLWINWVKMMGERDNPADSISFTIPQIVSPAGGFPALGLYDYFGAPITGQVGGGNTVSINALPVRAYMLIYDQWFRDQNLQLSQKPSTGDGPDTYTNYGLRQRNKKHDYFTSCLPWPLKGGVDVTLPLSGLANIKGLAIDNARTPTSGQPPASDESGGGIGVWAGYYSAATASTLYVRAASISAGADPIIQADLSTATGATINALRLAFQTQKLLERDARGGTRYTELLRAHFGVTPQDSRLQRPEYIGGGRSDFQTAAIPQTSATGLTGGTTPAGSLTAQATLAGQHTFSYHSTEHCYIIGVVHVDANLTYQQGLRKLWSRLTRYDFYWPAFAHLGEQAVLNKEIYSDGSAGDTGVFGYQERWAEYRHFPSQITGLFRDTNTAASPLTAWHSAQRFVGVPTLNSTFMASTPPFDKNRAVVTSGATFLFDSVFHISRTRPMPQYSVPGFIDRF